MDLIRHTHTHTLFLNSCLMPNFDQDQENRRLKESQTRGGGGGGGSDWLCFSHKQACKNCTYISFILSIYEILTRHTFIFLLSPLPPPLPLPLLPSLVSFTTRRYSQLIYNLQGFRFQPTKT